MFNETDTTTLTAIDPAAAEPDVSTEPDVALIEPAPRFTQRWQCPDCDNGITLHIRVVHAPICNNKARHSRRHIDMKKQKKGNPR
jgi:hypothetical protein